LPNNDASNVMRMDPATGLATVIHRDVNTGGAVSRQQERRACSSCRAALNPAVVQLEPTRKVLANSYNGEPLDCVGGVLNDLSADSRGGVYVQHHRCRRVLRHPAGVSCRSRARTCRAPTASS
jgi:hypothetical protein